MIHKHISSVGECGSVCGCGCKREESDDPWAVCASSCNSKKDNELMGQTFNFSA